MCRVQYVTAHMCPLKQQTRRRGEVLYQFNSRSLSYTHVLSVILSWLSVFVCLVHTFYRCSICSSTQVHLRPDFLLHTCTHAASLLHSHLYVLVLCLYEILNAIKKKNIYRVRIVVLRARLPVSVPHVS